MRTSIDSTPSHVATCHNEPLQSTDDLLNDATTWLQYARGVTLTLADLIHEAEEVDCQNLALSLEAIAAMTRMGTQQLGEARAQARWDAVAAEEAATFAANRRDEPPLAGFGGI
ncbi:hypothetical protein [Luteibacter aegosomatissinici]|uniref:hypothetical protein n=1 Tax=Luteibacter aegosomatissinici TaxID=2911539 RepID=UPI001FFA2D4D|nr:hypothetical protein [Luteibacter aegosomatissinici]UPG96488.1 hypothetical protein L2Y97_10345 [Luteibacter aegosomatissinici]